MSEWDVLAPDWDGDPGARAYAAAAFASLEAVLKGGDRPDRDLAGAQVLDFGCGSGLLTERLVEHGASVTAVDISTAMLAVLQTKIDDRGWSDVRATTELPEPPGSFDLIVCSSVCSFVDDYPATAKRLVDLLTPGGLFVQWDWERPDAGADPDEEPYGLSHHEIVGALQAAGLAQVVVDVGFEIPFGDETMRPLMGRGVRP